MLFQYSYEYDPPAPVIEMTLISPVDANLYLTYTAQLDTGADITTIPLSIIEILDLMPAREIAVRGYDNKITVRLTYYVNLRIANFDFSPIEILSSAGNDFLIGRDILNQWIITLDGKIGKFEIKD